MMEQDEAPRHSKRRSRRHDSSDSESDSEDEEVLRDLANEYLSSLGYQVHIAENGLQAIKILQRQDTNINLLFSDVVMPGDITGFELADRASQLRPGIKILMTTGYSSLPSTSDSSENILYKPYTRRILAIRIRSTLDKI